MRVGHCQAFNNEKAAVSLGTAAFFYANYFVVVQQRWVASHLSLNHWLRPSPRDSP